MQPATKKLGEMLVDARLITASQLQDALRHQRIAGGRMGSNLVALGFISEDVLMDFLARKTGVPRMELKDLDVPQAVLRRIPQRLADQLNVLPVALKEPKSLVLAMTDPSDLNAIDSARFASGLNIEPVVASYSTLRAAIADQYRKLAESESRTIEVSGPANLDEALPVPFDIPITFSSDPRSTHPPTRAYSADPFFDKASDPTVSLDPFSLFEPETLSDPLPDSSPLPTGPRLVDLPPAATSTATSGFSGSEIIHERTSGTAPLRRLESYETRILVMGLIRLFQRRGVIGQDELQRLIANLIESGELEDGSRGVGSIF